jgi:hypothetical protein
MTPNTVVIQGWRSFESFLRQGDEYGGKREKRYFSSEDLSSEISILHVE